MVKGRKFRTAENLVAIANVVIRILGYGFWEHWTQLNLDELFFNHKLKFHNAWKQ